MLAFFEDWGWQSTAVVGAVALAAILAIVIHRLRGQKQQLTTAIEHMSQGLCLYDRDERLAFCNQRYLEMYGFQP